MPPKEHHPDNDIHKGAVEDDCRESSIHHDESNGSMRGQMGHRNLDEMLTGMDTDFPEPGECPEHSGQSTKPSHAQPSGKPERSSGPRVA